MRYNKPHPPYNGKWCLRCKRALCRGKKLICGPCLRALVVERQLKDIEKERRRAEYVPFPSRRVAGEPVGRSVDETSGNVAVPVKRQRVGRWKILREDWDAGAWQVGRWDY